MNQREVNQLLARYDGGQSPDFSEPEPYPQDAPSAPSAPNAPSADDVRARLAEVEAEVERATLAMVRLWSKLHDMNKEG